MPQRLLFLFICFLLSPIIGFCESPSASSLNTVEELIVISEADYEMIQLQFTEPFSEPVSPNFDPGQVRLSLPQSAFVPEVENRHINDRFLKGTRFYQEGKNSILEIHFSDSKFKAIGRVKTKNEFNKLNIYIDKTSEITSSIFEKEVSNDQQVDETQSQPLSSLSDDFFQSADVTVSIVKMLVALSALLVFLYLILWVYNRFFVSRFNIKRGNQQIKLISSYHISPKQKIILLAINNKTFACGVTANNINVISEVSDNAFDSFISQFEYNKKETIDFTKLRTQYLESRRKGPQDSSDTGKTSFSSELLKRVKRLKPID